jgi:hypothetical protein
MPVVSALLLGVAVGISDWWPRGEAERMFDLIAALLGSPGHQR